MKKLFIFPLVVLFYFFAQENVPLQTTLKAKELISNAYLLQLLPEANVIVESPCGDLIPCPPDCIVNAVCKDITVSLVNGVAEITADDVDNGSTATCGIASKSISRTRFTCSDLSGSEGGNVFAVTLTITDAQGNLDFCEAKVTVTRPIVNAICKDITVSLVNGVAEITADDVDNGSTATCGIASKSISRTRFTCSDLSDIEGGNVVGILFRVTDTQGKTATCFPYITILDIPKCNITWTPISSIGDVNTGGEVNSIYLGYGPQKVKLNANAAGGNQFTYLWSGPDENNLDNKNSATPIYSPTKAGSFTFTLTLTNNYGCTTTCSITFCVWDIRVPGNSGNKVWVCQSKPNGEVPLQKAPNAVKQFLLNRPGNKLGICGQQRCTDANAGVQNLQDMNQQMINAQGGTMNEITTDSKLKLQAFPNPGVDGFTINASSLNTKDKINLKVLDMSGRVVEQKTLTANQDLQVGAAYKPGMYYVEVLQGKQKTTLKLIKQ